MPFCAEFRSVRRLAISLATGVSLGSLCSPALAQVAASVDQTGTTQADPAPTGSTEVGTDNDIVVTARYKQERLSEVPLSITALTGDVLRNNGVDNIRDIAYLTSGLTVRSLGSEYGSRPIVRGQGDLSAGVGDANVSVFIDGVYIFNSGAVNAGFADIDRVEVVKGPVSALYGRNAASGAINYITHRPGQEIEGFAKVTGGGDGLFEARGSISGPIIPGILSIGLSGLYGSSDGTYKDKVNGQRAGGYEKKDFRLAATLTPTEGMSFFAAWYHGDDRFDLAPAISADPNCGIARGGNAANPGGLPATNGALALFAPASRFCGKFDPRGDVQVPLPAAGATGNNRRFDLVTLNIAFETPIGTVLATTGYSDVRVLRYGDFSGGIRAGAQQPIIDATLASQNIGTAAPRTITINPFFGQDIITHDLSQELRYQSPQDKPIRIQAGTFLYQGSQRFNNNFALIGSVPAGFAAATVAPVYPAGTSVLTRVLGLNAIISPNGAINLANITSSAATFDQQAIFAGGELDLFRGLTVSGEARRTWDERGYRAVSAFNFFAPTSTPGTLRARQDFAYNNWRATVKYTPQPGIMVYASAATGTKAGGFNTTQAAAGFEYEQSFDPESNTTYEAGAKLSLLDRKLQLSAAGYHIDASGLQVFGTSNNPGNASLIVRNLAGVKTDGFEFDAVLRPVRGASVNVAVGYSDPRISKGTFQVYSANPLAPVAAAVTCQQVASCAPRLVKLATAQNANPQFANAVDLQGNTPPQLSKWQVTVGGDLDGQMSSDLGWFLHGDYRYESRQFVDVEDYAYVASRNLVNLRAGLTYRQFRLTAFVENLTNNRTPEGVAYNTRLSDLTSTILAGALPTARQVGASLEVRF